MTASLASLLEALERLSLEAIPLTLERWKTDAPICAIALWLDMEGYEHVLPPGLAVAYESERRASLGKKTSSSAHANTSTRSHDD